MLEEMLGRSIVKQVQFRNDCLWTPLTERFHDAKRHSCRLFPEENKCGGSYQAFRKMLLTWTSLLVVALMQSCRKAMLKHSKNDRWIVLGVDGTRLGVPYSEANELSLSAHRGTSPPDYRGNGALVRRTPANANT